MKKLITILLALVCILTLAVPAFAVESRAISIYPNVTISDGNATGSVSIGADSSSDSISVRVELYEDGVVMRIWTETGTGSVYTSRTIGANSGSTYTVYAYPTINNVAYSMRQASRVCP